MSLQALNDGRPFSICQTLDAVLQALAVRAIVFCEEQRVPYKLEYDAGDTEALHMVGVIDSEPVAAARLRFFADYAKLERIAIRKGFRGRHLGHALVDFMIEVARQRGFRKFKLSAQVHLEAFYTAHGFRATGERFLEAGIDHCAMIKEER